MHLLHRCLERGALGTYLRTYQPVAYGNGAATPFNRRVAKIPTLDLIYKEKTTLTLYFSFIYVNKTLDHDSKNTVWEVKISVWYVLFINSVCHMYVCMLEVCEILDYETLRSRLLSGVTEVVPGV